MDGGGLLGLKRKYSVSEAFRGEYGPFRGRFGLETWILGWVFGVRERVALAKGLGEGRM